jgi:hypothetical protein
VRHKYKTKNIKTDSNEVFLATKNQTRANTSSSRNLRLTATRMCKVWLSGSFDCPLKKIIRVIPAIRVNTVDKITIADKEIFKITCDTNRYPINNNRIYRNNNCRKYFLP